MSFPGSAERFGSLMFLGDEQQHTHGWSAGPICALTFYIAGLHVASGGGAT